MRKRLLSLVLALTLCIGVLPFGAMASGEAGAADGVSGDPGGTSGTDLPGSLTSYAGTAADSGACGKNLTWSLDESGVLTISGEGEMEDSPWRDSSRFAALESVSVVIEDGVTSIGDWAFCECANLTDVTIPESVTSIGSNAFYDCSGLTDIEIPDSVTSIGDWAFSNCTGFTDIEIPGSVADIGGWAFEWCVNLVSVEMGSGVKRIGESAFSNCSGLTFAEIPDTVTSIGNSAFASCVSLTGVEIPGSVTSIGDWAFSDCSSITDVKIDGETEIGYWAFYGCSSLTDITIPGNVADIGSWAFEYCENLRRVEIESGVKSLGYGTFEWCGGLIRVEIGDGLESVGDYAFDGCQSLTDVIFLGDAPEFGYDVFNGVTATVYYPAGNATWTELVMQDYSGDITWTAYDDPDEIPPYEGPAGPEAPFSFLDGGEVDILFFYDSFSWIIVRIPVSDGWAYDADSRGMCLPGAGNDSGYSGLADPYNLWDHGGVWYDHPGGIMP